MVIHPDRVIKLMKAADLCVMSAKDLGMTDPTHDDTSGSYGIEVIYHEGRSPDELGRTTGPTIVVYNCITGPLCVATVEHYPSLATLMQSEILAGQVEREIIKTGEALHDSLTKKLAALEEADAEQ
jgi:hypothetical protein